MLPPRHTEACVLACPRVCVHWHYTLDATSWSQSSAGGCSRPIISPLRNKPRPPTSVCLLSRGLSLGVEAMVLLGHRDTPPRDLEVQAWLRGWLRGLDSIPTRNSAGLGSLSRAQENPEPRWGEEGRGGCRESGVAEPRLRPPANRMYPRPRRKSWPLILALTRRPRVPLCCSPRADRDQVRRLSCSLRCRHLGSKAWGSHPYADHSQTGTPV